MADREELYFGTADVDHNYSEVEPIEIARISSGTKRKVIMRVYYDKHTYDKYNLHFCVRTANDEEFGKIPYVYVDDEHKACLYDKPNVFYALLLHELGHFMNKDSEKAPKGLTSDDIRHQRHDLILQGKVQECELNADAFAVAIVGKNTMLRALDYMINKRRLRTEDPGKEIAIKEFQLRKRAIQNR